MQTITWLGIFVCLSQSAIFSGLNLALMGFGRMRLEAEAEAGDRDAIRVLALRRDSNFLLTTVLWGNVAVNVLLTLLSDSVMAGVGAFLFSTVGITMFGEILPQAYFSRNALRVGARLAPLVAVYQVVLFPVAKPTAMLLDWWLGREGMSFMRERNLRHVIKMHMEAGDADVSHVEGRGALNFLALDDLAVREEGEIVDPESIVSLPMRGELPIFPPFERSPGDSFLRKVQASGEKWVIIVDDVGRPQLALNADSFLRAALFGDGVCNPYAFCHRPVIVDDPDTPLGKVMRKLRVTSKSSEDDVVDLDLILLWARERRIVTGADLFGRLLRGIATRQGAETVPA